MMPITQWIDHNAGLSPGKAALRFGGRDLNYGDFAALVERAAKSP
ncbi:MAG: long-chain fatty acid--CoA ligase [Rhodocyclaceae bacterium]|nr:MAG: long-chain fatty acid--CoA ligase [Rhodocyclaceae bacterium]